MDTCLALKNKPKLFSASQASPRPARRGARSEASSKAGRDRHGRSNDLFPPPTPRVPQVAFEDPRMNDRNLIAAYPDPEDRRDAIEEAYGVTVSMKEALAASPGLRKKPQPLRPLNDANDAQRIPLNTAKAQPKTIVKSSTFTTLRPGRSRKRRDRNSAPRPMATNPLSPVRLSSVAAPSARIVMDSKQLSNEPFWLKATTTAPTKPDASDRETRAVEQSSKSANDRSLSAARSSRSEIIKQSSKGYLQERGEEVPPHYNKVVFPPQPPKRADSTDDKSPESDSDYESDVYSDVNLKPANAVNKDTPEDELSDSSSLVPRTAYKRELMRPLSKGRGLVAVHHSALLSTPLTEDKVLPETYFAKRSADTAVKLITRRIALDEEESALLSALRATGLQVSGYDVIVCPMNEFAPVNQATPTVTAGDSNPSQNSKSISDDKSRYPVENRPNRDSVNSSGNGNRGRLLFKISLDDGGDVAEVYEYDSPPAVALKICQENQIDNPLVRDRFSSQIARKFQRALERLQVV